MKKIFTEILIESAPKKIWQILTDFDRFPNWNPFMKEISGSLDIDAKLKVHISPPGGASMKFSPKIISLIPEKQLIWKGKFLIPNLFDGEHKFIMQEEGNVTKFIQEELFTGILTSIMPDSIYRNTEAGFNAMNLALKEECEKK